MLLVATALAAPSAESETLAQVRHDFFGERSVPVATFLRLYEDNAYASMQAAMRLDQDAELDLYLLSASSTRPWGHWGVGRLLASAPMRPQIIDGASLGWRHQGFSVEGWGGVARQLELEDLHEGQPMARTQASWSSRSLWVRAGATLDSELRGDAELLYRSPGLPGRPSASLLAVASPDTPTEWLRVEVGAAPASRLRLSAHAQHREAVDPQGLLGEAITASLARGGVDEVGLGVRLSSATWSAVSATYALSRYDEQGEPVMGHAVDASWLPPRSDGVLRVSPAYRYRSGPGGQFHATYATASLSLGDRRQLIGRAAVVPYQKLSDPWDTALTAGLELRQGWRWAEIRGGLEAASDATYSFDLRGSCALILRWP